MYSAGESEEIVGQALRGRRDDVVLATKAHGAMGRDINMKGNSRRWLVREVEDSLRRLQTDYIDLYQIHRPDQHTDIEETLSALSDLVHSGKVRAIGSSTFPAEQIVEAQWVAERRGLCPVPERAAAVFDLRPRRRGLGAADLREVRHGCHPVEPAGGGWLTGRIRKDTGVDMTTGRARRVPSRFDQALPGNQAKLDAVEELIKIAADAGCSLTHMALAFVVAHPAVTAAIIGPRTMDQLTDILAGADTTLEDDILDRIDQIVPPGVNLNASDAGFQPRALADADARRRPLARRAASLAVPSTVRRVKRAGREA